MILHLYRYNAVNAPTIMEHVNSFKNYSKYDVINMNVMWGLPKHIDEIKFDVIILHYSVFLALPEIFIHYIKKQTKSIKIGFYQDDYHNCIERFKLINELSIDIVYTLLDDEYHYIYKDNTNVKFVKQTLAGYLDDALLIKTKTFYKPNNQRGIDIGYRARPLPYHLGIGGQEKTLIAEEFIRRLSSSNLTLDIKTAEEDRIYGDNWYRFLANCKGMIGVEAGSSIFDIDGTIQKESENYLKNYPDATFEEVFESILKPFENNIPYRVLSPRIFEAAALRVCMILFEGKYNGIIKPNIHYIPLKKDCSNFDQVITIYKDPVERKRLIENAYNDLVSSGEYHYSNFINEFDNTLIEIGLAPNISKEKIKQTKKILNKDIFVRVYLTKLFLFLGEITPYIIKMKLRSLGRRLFPDIKDRMKIKKKYLPFRTF